MGKVKQQWKAKSSSSDKLYTVTNYIDGSWACSCPHYIYRLNGTNKVCKHITAAQDGEYDELDTPKEIHLRLANVDYFKKLEEDATSITYGVPLVPADNRMSAFVATIIYDACVLFNIPWSVVKEQYAQRWKISKTQAIEYVEARGRTIWDTTRDKKGKTIKSVPKRTWDYVKDRSYLDTYSENSENAKRR